MTRWAKQCAAYSTGMSTLTVVLSAPFTGSTNAAVFPPVPERYWEYNVVYYRFQPILERMGVCEPQSSPAVDCDTGNGDADCGAGETCEPLAGRCVPDQMPEWGECRVDSDCAAGGVCNELSGRCLGAPLPAYATCDQDNPVACASGEACLPKTVANPCIAMQLWAQVANIIFVEVGCDDEPLCPGLGCWDEVPDHNVVFALTYGDPTSSYVGVFQNGAQSIGVNPDGNFAWGFVHEVGHALGFYHEMRRNDREAYVDVYTDRVVSGKEANYNESETDFFYPTAAHGYAEAFDFDSIMMYPLCVYSECNYQRDEDDNVIFDDDTGEPVARNDCGSNPPEPCCVAAVDNACRPIDPVDEWAAVWSGREHEIGQRDHFSKLDALTASFLYPEWNWRFVDKVSPAEEGTFIRPYRTFFGGVDAVPPGGTLFVQPGSYDGVGDLTKPMTIRAPIGPVQLGD